MIQKFCLIHFEIEFDDLFIFLVNENEFDVS